MDVSGVFLCTLCRNTLNLLDKKVELACNHSFHTKCFIIYTSHHTVQCPICRENLFTDEIHQLGNQQYREDREEREKKIYKELTETPGFLDNLKVYRKQLMLTKKSYANFRKIGTLARRGFRTETAALRAIIQSMRKTGIQKLRDSSELKELIKATNEVYLSRGNIKKPIPEEKRTMDFAFASVAAIEDIFKGEILNSKNIFPLRPNSGHFKIKDYERLLGRKVKKDIKKGFQLKKNDV
jgi:hypothetical protein